MLVLVLLYTYSYMSVGAGRARPATARKSSVWGFGCKFTSYSIA